jgi:2Fe-2S type ferredoxin
VTVYSVRLRDPGTGADTVVPCREDQPILDAAEARGIALPYSCRSASCGTCVGQVLEGRVVLEEQFVLGEGDLARGLTCLCSATPSSDLLVLTRQSAAVEGG